MADSSTALREPTEKHTNGTHASPPRENDTKHSHRAKAARHLFKKPTVRQYVSIRDQSIWKEKDEREPSRFELFFDLIFVGIIHQLSEGATEVFSGLNVAKFIVLFYPSWVIWQDTRAFVNVSGTDDILQRIYILVIMGCLLGYSANASAIEISSSPESSEEEEHGLSSLRGAILFFIVAKILRLSLHIIYAFVLPKFRGAQTYAALGIVAQSAIYFPLIWVTNTTAFWILMGVGVGSQLFGFLVVAFLRTSSGHSSKLQIDFVPALSIEHHIERTSQFIIIVLGEAVINLTYRASGGEAGIHREFGRAVMGLASAYFLSWLYFDQDSSTVFIHALRRHWFTAFASNVLHYPLACGLIIWSSSLKNVVAGTGELENGVRWYFGGGLAVALFTLAALGLLHKNLDLRGSSLIPHLIRIIIRLAAAIVFALLPLSKGLTDSGKWLGVHCAILAILVILETVGKLGATADRDELTGEIRTVRVSKGTAGETEQEAHHADMSALTDMERGEDDAGIEGALKETEVRPISKKHTRAIAVA